MRRAGLVMTVLLVVDAIGQVPVPFVTDEDRFMVFTEGRFEKMEPRPPAFVRAMEGQVVYRDHQGQLKVFLPDGRRLHLSDREGGEPRGTRSRIAWLSSDTLKTVREGRAHIVATGVQDFSVSDSLIIVHDSLARTLDVLWRGKRYPMVEVLQGSARPQWSVGSSMAAVFNKESRRLMLFHQGKVRTLCDSTDLGLVVMGDGLIGYWDDHAKEFKLFSDKGVEKLSDLRPADAKAGAGLLAFVDGNGRFKCYAKGGVQRLLDEPPSGFWVKDSLLLYLDKGRLMLFDQERVMMVEQYVPENWKVEGGLLAYLDINRELRGIESGERFRFGTEANIAAFDLFGQAVVYRSPLGNTVVATRRRTYVF